MTALGDPLSPSAVDPRAVMRKVTWRIVPLALAMYVTAYLDRANVGFAKLSMKEKLGFTEDVFGWAFGTFFFAGYLLLEIPGALLVERWSARKWFARILLSWGVCSMAMAWVRTPGQFYTARFLLGLAEAGFFPGIIIYFTHWFPRAERGRAFAGMVLGVPLSLALGAQTSGWLMENADWFGLDGWQWMFIIEGLPAVLLGVAVPFLLTDRPAQARWLTPAERAWLTETIAAERREAAQLGGVTLRQALRQPIVWLLALGILATNIGGYSLAFWMATAVKSLLTQASSATPTAREVLNWTSGIYLCGLVGTWASGQLTDRLGAAKWLCMLGQIGTALALALVAAPNLAWPAVFTGLCLVGFFSAWWPTPFWVLPTLTLSASAAAVSIGFINICANIAGMIGPTLVGELKAAGYDEGTCMSLLAGCYVVGALIISQVHLPRRRPVAE